MKGRALLVRVDGVSCLLHRGGEQLLMMCSPSLMRTRTTAAEGSGSSPVHHFWLLGGRVRRRILAGQEVLHVVVHFSVLWDTTVMMRMHRRAEVRDLVRN